MSKRTGEDIDPNDPQKKQKTDLPTASSTSKISYGSSLKAQPASTSISYAALRKQQVKQVSTMNQPVKQATSAIQSSSNTPASLQTANLQQLQNTTKQVISQQVTKITTSNEKSKFESITKETTQENKKESSESQIKPNETEGMKSNETQGQIGVPKSVDLKSQQQQILERAKKQKEEEMKLKQLKKQEAVKQQMENTKKGIKPSGTQKTAQQLKEEQKSKEKKPLTKYEQEMQSLQKYAMKKELEKKRIEQLIKTGKIKPEDLEKQKPKEEIKSDAREKDSRLDEKGNLVDSKGNILVIDQKKSTLKMNDQKIQLEKVMKLKRNARFQNSQVFQDTNLFMTTSFKRDRKKIHALNFIEEESDEDEEKQNKMDIESSEGSDEDDEIQEKMEKEVEEDDNMQIEKNDDFRQLISKTEVDYRREEFQKSNSRYLQNLHKKKQSLKQKHHDPIPDIEWWDLPLFDQTRRYYLPLEQIQTIKTNDENQQKQQGDNGSQQYVQGEIQNSSANENNLTINILDNLENIKQQLSKLQGEDFKYSTDYYRKEKVTHLIEHPKPFKNEGLPNQNAMIIIPNYMTKQEQKKLRRRHRLEKEKEKQDKIKLGLLPAPAPKVRLKNMMRVLGNEAVADPTKMEALVRQGIADRLQEHLRRNEERKLTKEQKAEKFLRKLKRDSSIECRVALFRIENLQDRVHKFKIDINAQQMQLHGLLINPVINPESRSSNNMPAIVLVEGGPKAIKFYKKLLLRRIKWNKNSYLPKDENGEVITPVNLSENKCALVWEGIVKDHSFNKWRVVDADSEVEAKRPFSEKNVDFYFDMAINYQYPQ